VDNNVDNLWINRGKVTKKWVILPEIVFYFC